MINELKNLFASIYHKNP